MYITRSEYTIGGESRTEALLNITGPTRSCIGKLQSSRQYGVPWQCQGETPAMLYDTWHLRFYVRTDVSYYSAFQEVEKVFARPRKTLIPYPAVSSFTMDGPDQSHCGDWSRDETRPLLSTEAENVLSRDNYYASHKSSKKSWSTTIPLSLALCGMLPSLFFR